MKLKLKRFTGLAVLVLCVILTQIASPVSADVYYFYYDSNVSPARNETARYAYEILNYPWTTNATIYRYNGKDNNGNYYTPGTTTGEIHGLPYCTDSGCCSLEDYNNLELWQKEQTSWPKMIYGMQCASLVTDCIRHGLDLCNIYVPFDNQCVFHHRAYWKNNVKTIASSWLWDDNISKQEWIDGWDNESKSIVTANRYKAYQDLKRGDYLDNYDHCILVIDNDGSGTMTCIDQTICYYISETDRVGTRIRFDVSYSKLAEDRYVPMYVQYPDDPDDNEPAPTNLTFNGKTDTFVNRSYNPDNTESITASGSNIQYKIVHQNVTINDNTVTGTLPAGLNLDSSTGKITGSAFNTLYDGNPDSVYRYYPITYKFTVRAENSGGYIDKECSINVWEGPKIQTSETLYEGTVGTEYEQEISVSGTESGLKWLKYSDGNLPDGLTFYANNDSRIAKIKGTPTKAGTYTFTLAVYNNNHISFHGGDGRATRKFTLKINPKSEAPTITTSSLPDAYVGEKYSAKIQATGDGTITYNVTENELRMEANELYSPFFDNGFYFEDMGSTLPSSSLSALSYMMVNGSKTGNITGIPVTKRDNLTLTLTAKNSAGSKQRTYTIKVINRGNGPDITTSNILPAAGKNVYYSAPITETGGVTPITWSNVDGSLPPGLSLSNSTSRTVYLNGYPTSNGTYEFTLKASDSTSLPAPHDKKHLYDEKKFTIIVTDPVKISGKFKDGTKGQSYYDNSVTISGGTAPYTYEKISGSLPTNLSLSISGSKLVLSGTPGSAGSYPFKVRVTDKNGLYADESFTVKIIEAKPVIVINGTFENGTVGEYYSDYVTASGGTAPYTWTKTKGTLPSGLSLSGSGEKGYLQGTPTTADTYTFSLIATDKYGYSSDPTKFTIVINPAPATAPKITTTSLPKGQVGKAYSAQINATGTAPITYKMTGAPNWLKLNENTGALTGTPTSAGNFKITFNVKNSAGSDSTTLDLTIKLSINGTFKNGTVGGHYYDYVTVSGGTSPYTWTKTSDSDLPSGIYVFPSNSKCYLEGDTTQTGTYTLYLKVTDKYGYSSDTTKFTIVINPATATAPKITTPSLPDGQVDKAYSAQVKATGTTPITYKMTGAPSGLSINESTGAITGTPSSSGEFRVSITAKNSAGSDSAKLTLNVKESSPFDVGDTFASATAKQKYSASITVTGGTLPIKRQLVKGTLPPGLKLKHSGRVTTLSGTPSKAGTYEFTLKATDKNNLTVEKTFSISVSPALSLTGTLANTGIGQTYSKTLTISGGAEPYTFSYSGKIPSGLKLTHSGSSLTLSGEPDTKGKYTFKINVTDGNGAKISKSYTVTVQAALDTKKTFTHYGIVGKSYNSSINITGGTAPYSIDYNPDELPEGLKLTKSGSTLKLSGKPTQAGSYSFKLIITEKNEASLTTGAFNIEISDPLKIPDIFTNTGAIDEDYSSSVNITGGKAPYTFNKTSGSLPKGLGLELSGSKLTLSGTPGKLGKYSFTVKITDANKRTVSKKFTVKVSKAQAEEEIKQQSYLLTGKNKTSDTDTMTDNTLPETPENIITGTQKNALKVNLSVSSKDIISQCSGRDEDIIKVKANEPVTFEVSGFDSDKVSHKDFIIIYDFNPIEDITLDDGWTFTLPAEMVSGDFAVKVSADVENYEYESDELYLEAVSE